MKRYIWNLLIAIDQLINAICGGDPDETISSRIGKRRDEAERFWSRVVDKIFFWQRGHTKNAVEEDEGKDGVA